MTSPKRAAALLAGVRIDATTKGFPALTEPVPISDVPNRGWTADEENRLVNWFLGTQQGWFAQFGGKGVEFPAFWQTVLSDFAANHHDAFMRVTSDATRTEAA